MWSTIRHLIRLTSLRHITGHRARTGAALLGMVMGISTFIFAPTLGLTIRQASLNAVDDITGRADLEIRGDEAGFDPALLDTVQNTPGVSLVAPLTMGGGVMVGQGELLVFFGIDPAVDGEMRDYTLTAGEFADAAGELMLPQGYAAEKGLEIGETAVLVGQGGLRTLTLTGILADSGVARLNSGDIAVMTLADAQGLRGEKLDSIAITAADGQDIAALGASLAAALPDTLKVDYPAGRLASGLEFQSIAMGIILMVSSMILALGATLIYNTMAFSVAQRRAEIGILRALGVSQRDIRRLFLVESGVLGLLGSVLGVIAGYGLVAIGNNMSVVPPTIALTSSAAIEVPLWLIPVTVILGVAISCVAGYLPSRTASQVDPVEAMVQIRAETGTVRAPMRRVMIALAVLAITLLVGYRAPSNAIGVMIGNTAVMTLVFAGVLLYPPLMVWLGRFIPAVMSRLFGTAGYIAAGNLTRRPGRIMAVGILVMLGVWSGTMTSGTNFGYTDFINQWQSKENVWELTAMGAGRDPFSPIVSVPPEVVDAIQARPDVAGTAAERFTSLQYGATATIFLRAVDTADAVANGGGLLWLSGEESYARLQDAERPALLISGAQAFMENQTVGSSITLDTPQGAVDFEIVGTTFGTIDQTVVVMDRNVYRRYWHDDRVDRLMIRLEPGTDGQAVRRDLLREYAINGVLVADNGDLSAAFLDKLNGISGVSQILSSLLLVILVAGLASTLYITVLDRRREIGMLRAVGMLRRQITAGILLEAVLLVIIGCIIGIPGAAFSVQVGSRAIHQMMGIQFNALDVGQVMVTLVLILVTVLVASAFPARQAGRTDVLEAMRYE